MPKHREQAVEEPRPTSRPGVTLRRLEDREGELLFQLFVAARDDLAAAIADWGAARRDAFLRMQFDARQAQYARDFPDARVDVIVSDGEPVGSLSVAQLHGSIRIVDVALLPAHRNRGIGTAVLEGLLDAAGPSGQRVSLHVGQANPARRLYERLGFIATAEHGPYVFMTWSKTAPAANRSRNVS